MLNNVFNGYIVYSIKKYGTIEKKKEYMKKIINIIYN